jgi:hypothetical protein
VGSRGVANIAEITTAVVSELKALEAKPFVVPTMGSHGGATAEGQRTILEALDVTEEVVGAPIYSSMETVVVGYTEDGKPVHMDKYAYEADGTIVMGRVKPHTAFRGSFESGLMKMMAIGLGKQKGAEICHSEGFSKMHHYVESFGHVMLENANILFGIPIVENAFDDTYRISSLTVEEIPEEEPGLLEEARALMPRIKFPDLDVLIVDEIGKNFSGDGMDPNITGSYATPYASGKPDVMRYVVLDLSDETHGNAIGAGMAQFVTKRLFDKTDFDAATPNALTSRTPPPAKMGIIMKDDWHAIAAGIFTCDGIEHREPRVVRIPNTSHINHIEISGGLLDQARAQPEIEILTEPYELPFDESGNLTDISSKMRREGKAQH